MKFLNRRWWIMISVGSLMLFFVRYYFFLHTPFPVDERGYIVVIPPKTSVFQITLKLSQDKVIKKPDCFLVWAYTSGLWKHIQAGEYLIKSDMYPSRLGLNLRQGRVIQHALTIVPGWTFEQLLLAIAQSSVLTHTVLGMQPAEIMEKLGYAGKHPEGFFFPETYYFPRGTTDLSFLKRAAASMQKQLTQVWETHSLELCVQSPYEVLILASIIEKETSEPTEYAEIAGVLNRRLKKKMPLQVDPTVIYGAGKHFTGILTMQLLKSNNAYNTYQNLGLPPTPIAMPSLLALKAAANPKPGTALYFVASATGKGHVFSDTLEAHQIAVQQYRQRRQVP